MRNKRAFLKEAQKINFLVHSKIKFLKVSGRTEFKMDKRGFELGISTLILLILGVLLLAGLVFFMNTGFGDFGDKIKMYIFYSNVDYVVNSCNMLVDGNMVYRYCCEKNKVKYYIDGEKKSGDFTCNGMLNESFAINLKEMSCDENKC